MLVLSAADYFYQRWDLEKEMKMTKQEIKEEIKSREGDPMIRARIKRIQREMASKRMMEDVPKADVIVTNPTHIAVALKYDDTMVAPTVIAKGADLIAEKIREMAREFNIPIIENKPLARSMFKTLKIGQTIPKELYTAVAEVLSYVYKLRRKKVR
jgi:flagellar biosynthetic protein FlhB